MIQSGQISARTKSVSAPSPYVRFGGVVELCSRLWLVVAVRHTQCQRRDVTQVEIKCGKADNDLQKRSPGFGIKLRKELHIEMLNEKCWYILLLKLMNTVILHLFRVAYYCIVLYSIAVYCVMLNWFMLYSINCFGQLCVTVKCNVLYWLIQHCIIYRVETNCVLLYWTVLTPLQSLTVVIRSTFVDSFQPGTGERAKGGYRFTVNRCFHFINEV